MLPEGRWKTEAAKRFVPNNLKQLKSPNFYSEPVYLSLLLHQVWQMSVFLKLPQKNCSSSCLWRSCAVFLSLVSPLLLPHLSGHFPDCHLGRPGEDLREETEYFDSWKHSDNDLLKSSMSKHCLFFKLDRLHINQNGYVVRFSKYEFLVWISANSNDRPFLTCVTVRRILSPLSWSLRLLSRFSSSPDSCSSSGWSSTTASWFTLMSGIKDWRTRTNWLKIISILQS